MRPEVGQQTAVMALSALAHLGVVGGWLTLATGPSAPPVPPKPLPVTVQLIPPVLPASPLPPPAQAAESASAASEASAMSAAPPAIAPAPTVTSKAAPSPVRTAVVRAPAKPLPKSLPKPQQQAKREAKPSPKPPPKPLTPPKPQPKPLPKPKAVVPPKPTSKPALASKPASKPAVPTPPTATPLSGGNWRGVDSASTARSAPAKTARASAADSGAGSSGSSGRAGARSGRLPASVASDSAPKGQGQSLGDSPATPAYRPEPVYPAFARRLGHEGRVVIRLQVLSSGAVAAARIERSSGYAVLDESALAAVKRWRFRPAQRAGQPVDTTLNVPITFRLQQPG